MNRVGEWISPGLVLLMLAAAAVPVHARPDEETLAELRASFPELFAAPGEGSARPEALPDIFGPGAVLNVGNVHMKVINFGFLGQVIPLSSDPGGQWPGLSGVEYLSFIAWSVGAVKRSAPDPADMRRVSYATEWRPKTLDPEDRLYRSYDGQARGVRNSDDDQDSKGRIARETALWIDEDFLDGRDNDGDGKIDEDFAAYGQQMWSGAMWDNSEEAKSATFNEKHVPIDLECRQTAWAYSVPGFQDFNVIHWTIINRSGVPLDSMYFGVRADMDAGPFENPAYFADDVDLPFFPRGDFTVELSSASKWGDKMDPKGFRRQQFHADMPEVPSDSALCPRVVVRVNGFSVGDNDGDEGRTPGIASVLLLGHTTDPKGLMAPKRVGWSGFRSHVAGTPYVSGGNPVTDAQRAEMFRLELGVHAETGFIDVAPVDQEGDIQAWGLIGPFGNIDPQTGRANPIPDGGSIEVTIAFAVQRQPGGVATVNQYPADYEGYLQGRLSAQDLFEKYPPLENAFAAQVAYEGVYDNPPAELQDDEYANTPDFHGRETRVIAPQGFVLNVSDPACREGGLRPVTEFRYSWFDFDCDWCTGVWAFGSGPGGGSGKYLKRWNTAAPPPGPNLNVSSSHNFRDNPDRAVVAAGDKMVTLAWDNLSEVSLDPEKGHFDFRSYLVWKAADWRRPVGSTGPAENDWLLLGHYRFFDYAESNRERFPAAAMSARGFWRPAIDSVVIGNQPVCPQVFIPNLSLQTLVVRKSGFADSKAAEDWVRAWLLANGYRCRELASDNNVLCPPPVSDDGASWRFRLASGECRPGSFHTVEVAADVRAEVCLNSLAGARGFVVPICLTWGDIWDRQSGDVLRAAPENCPQRAPNGVCLTDTVACVPDTIGCRVERGRAVDTEISIARTRYGIGRYRLVDREVKNGFIYFYSVAAGDSTGNGTIDTRDDELYGRRTAVEADGVVPQEGVRSSREVWVVPNPYRGYSDLNLRTSSWDLTPNATDPTGTHVDFFGMPAGPWTLSIFTVSGDLVQVLRSTDQVNEAVRGPAVVRNPAYDPTKKETDQNPKTITVAGYNRQQDNPNDGQARWNLITRSGQDVVSGIYLFVVESNLGTQRGKFVIIR